VASIPATIARSKNIAATATLIIVNGKFARDSQTPAAEVDKGENKNPKKTKTKKNRKTFFLNKDEKSFLNIWGVKFWDIKLL
jgi:hypothetical protein